MEQELSNLSTVQRREIAQRLREVLPGGDVLENSELEDARNAHSFLEGRIQELKRVLADAIIIEEIGPSDTVELGSRVTVVDLTGDGIPETYRIVGSPEADPTQGNISNESPLGRALMGCRVGEEISLATPDGELMFRVAEIR
jgi:transcription elongation factor GreA